ncbi:formate/nitrite transporter family protein [Aureimonas pseudogalii]|uniref:Formate/nitrite transporter FocA (FNT family) n=1 Tax=Aureimonas pseudogalii TaxID=1744844 RepID=A0A7W6H505_9HYPH|nr:formate/nitrite transporter family protein [Aureimonas pseudogalii]MBB3998672.1 formate/nitrite transporter FocA (FNT family) [Aureimonas pseudogalii]
MAERSEHTNEETQRRHDEEPTGLTSRELDEVDERHRLRPLAVYELVRQEGEDELSRPAASLWWSGLAAGLSIGFSVLTQAVLRVNLPDASWTPLVTSWGYSVGFLIVILGRQQLFTEITLTATLPVLAAPRYALVVSLLRLWAIVLAANFVGTAIFAAGIAWDVIAMPEIREAALAISREAVFEGWATLFLRAIVAGWLMATVVWLLPSAQHSSFVTVVLVTTLISMFHLAHVVAGSVEAMALVWNGELGFGAALANFYMPVLLGNVIGGAALFALLTYAQVATEMVEENPSKIK